MEMQNGCICCTCARTCCLRSWNLARSGRFDYLLIESTGISEPMPVAETFTFADEDGTRSVGRGQLLDTMVTVVDAKAFPRDLGKGEDLQERDIAAGEDDDRTIDELLVEQVEFANVLVISKPDLVSSPQELESLQAPCSPSASTPRRSRSSRSTGRSTSQKILATGRFDFEQGRRRNPAGSRILSGSEEASETEEYGVGSFVYRARRPFHPERLYSLLQAGLARRAPQQGLVLWLATPQRPRRHVAAGGRRVLVHLRRDSGGPPRRKTSGPKTMPDLRAEIR